MERQYKFLSHLQQKFHEFYKKEIFCDFEIECENRKFKLHRAYLAASSEFFRGMLLNDSKEAKEGKVTISNIKATSLDALILFIYTGSLELDDATVQDHLMAADFLQLYEVRDLCVEYIGERLDTSNCSAILTMASRLRIENLYSTASRFCCDNFEQIIKTEEFLELDESCFTSLISSDELDVSSEYIVFESILRYINHDLEARKPILHEAFSEIRLSLLDNKKLEAIIGTPLIKHSISCRDMIDQVLFEKLTGKESNERSLKTREPRRWSQRIYSLGGWSHGFQSLSTVEKYDPFNDYWTDVKPMTRPRCGVGAIILNNMLYAVGGHDGQNYLKSIERYDINGDVWLNDIPDMKYERTSVGVVSVDGRIYAIGGQSGVGPTDVVEKYNPELKLWEEISPMTTKRLGAGVAVLNGLIFVLGGADNSVLNSGECFDPNKKSWSSVKEMSTSRKHFGCTSFLGKIYVVGGRGNVSELDTAEVFDPATNKWESMPPMSTKRSGIGLVELNGKLYAVGGHDGDVRLKLVEEYDFKRRQWTVKNPMKYDRLGGGLAVHSYLKGKC